MKKISLYLAIMSASLVAGVVLSYGFSAAAAVAGYPVGHLYQPDYSTNAYSCDPEYTLTQYTFVSGGSTDNATWYACI